MLETYFSAAKMLGHLRSGPSGPYLDGFAEALERRGYGPETAVRYLRAAAHIGHVMTEQCAGLTDIDLAAFDEHLRTIELGLGIEIRNRANRYRLLGPAAEIARAQNLLRELFAVSEDRAIDAEEVHLALREHAAGIEPDADRTSS